MTDENREINAAAELAKAEKSLAAAGGLIRLGLYDDAASRLYYAAFHFASAALLMLGVEVATHRALMSLFSLHLIKPGLIDVESARILSNLMSLRHQADYNRHFEMDAEGARQERARAQRLIDELRAFLRSRGM